jgi:uncharacterized protein (DUF1697 family)
VRTAVEIDAVLAGNPFAREAREIPGYLHVLFLRQAADAGAYKALQAAIKGDEVVRGGGRHAYIVYPSGAGNSKLTPAILARHLGAPGTARNWNTVSKLAALAAG